MEIINLNLSQLHNEEHLQFNRGFKELVEQEGVEKLDIQESFGVYLTFYPKEEEALNLIRKNATTSEVEQADHDRDETIDGLTALIKVYTKHFNEEKREAAIRYKIMLDTYGRIARKPYDDETAAAHKMVEESRTTFAKDIATMQVTDWIDEVDVRNLAFEDLRNASFSEGAAKTRLRMKAVRSDIDKAYRDIVKRINALMLINGTSNYEAFVRELNSRIEKLNNTISQRRGRSKKNK